MKYLRSALNCKLKVRVTIQNFYFAKHAHYALEIITWLINGYMNVFTGYLLFPHHVMY